MKAIPYGKQFVSDEDIEAVNTVLRSDFLTQGPAVSEFEKAFAAYTGAKYAVAVSNGTAALHICALSLNVCKTSNVITTPITFAASANCIRYCEGTVWFVDIDPKTYTLDITQLKALLESKPKGFFSGVIPVNHTGYQTNLEAIKTIASKYGLWIIEDACHSPGAYFLDSKDQKHYSGNGKFADLSVFSFHPVKHIACGEGGMITTNNEALYKKLLLLRTHGITKDPASFSKNDGGWYYEMQTLGYNYRLTDIQAALGNSQLKRAAQGLVRRRKIAETYSNSFKNAPYILGQSGLIEGHAYHLYIIEVEDRKALYDFLKSKGIFCQVHYIPVHLLSYYQALGHKPQTYPNAERYYERTLSIPMYPTLTDDEQQYVINTIHNFYTH